jgi:hypothetical protein
MQASHAEDRIVQLILVPAIVARVLASAAALLIFASIAGQAAKYLLGFDRGWGLIPAFYVDSEQNIPTLYSVFLLLFAALLLGIVTWLKKREQDRDVSKWAVLSGGVLLMAVDEGASLHELLVAPTRGLLGPGTLGVFNFAWVIPAMGLVAGLGCFFVGFLLRLPGETRFRFITAAVLYLGGVIGMEMVGGRYAEVHGSQNLAYSMIATVEESLEMAGIIVFIHALLKYLGGNVQELRIRFSSAAGVRSG